ncbi:spore coat protein CotF [Arcicella rosea]|uniref:hypothetical protein n=1 Tax=Arcicella rosea TaxID=502909 RepID=UPI00345DDB2D
MKNWYSHWIVTLIIILLGISFIFYFPIFYVDILCQRFPALNLEPYGTIGDTIGGMTGPFINLAGAILVYVAFNEQRKSNLQIEETHKFDYLVQQIDKLESIVIDNEKFDISKIKDNIKQCLDNLEITTPEERDVEIFAGLKGPAISFYNQKYTLSEYDLSKIFLIEYMISNILEDFPVFEFDDKKNVSLFKRFLNIYLLIASIGLDDIIKALRNVDVKHLSKTIQSEKEIIKLSEENNKKIHEISDRLKKK